MCLVAPVSSHQFMISYHVHLFHNCKIFFLFLCDVSLPLRIVSFPMSTFFHKLAFLATCKTINILSFIFINIFSGFKILIMVIAPLSLLASRCIIAYSFSICLSFSQICFHHMTVVFSFCTRFLCCSWIQSLTMRSTNFISLFLF